MSGSVADTVEVRQGCLPSRVFSRIIDSLGEHHEGDTTRLTCLYNDRRKTLPFVDAIVLIVGCAAVLMESERKSTHARTRPSLQFPAKQQIHVCNNITMNGRCGQLPCRPTSRQHRANMLHQTNRYDET